MGLTGRLEGYTFYTFAEDTAKSPWEPYNVSQGFQKGDSTVTVSSAGNPAVFGGGAVAPWTAQGVMDQMAAQIRNRGVAWPHAQKHIVVLHPDCAVELANKGYTRKSLQEYLYSAHTRAIREASRRIGGIWRRLGRGTYPRISRRRANPRGPCPDFPG